MRDNFDSKFHSYGDYDFFFIFLEYFDLYKYMPSLTCY